MNPSIFLSNKKIDCYSSPYIIAEIGVNHEGSLDLAKKLIDLAKDGGANAAKFQSYKANTIASKNSPSYWDTTKEPTKSQYELFSKYDLFGEKEYEKLFLHCKELNIDFISTPFDHDSLNYLDKYVPFYKISSSDITNIPLLENAAKKGKPIVLSTGASSLDEIDYAIKKIELAAKDEIDIALLHCILNYPTHKNDANLNMITSLKQNYPSKVIGYSDHTLPDKEMSVLTSAYLLGAIIIEKHFTHDKNLPGNDHYHAMDIKDLKNFIEKVKFYNQLKGEYKTKDYIPSESISRKNARRSLVINKNLEKGHKIKKDDLICKRPGSGISPIEINKVIGKQISRNLVSDSILKWSDIIKH